MSATELPTWLQYAQALVAPVVTVAGIVIAWGQFSLARMRAQHDLYDRRYKIFEGARRLIIDVMREGRVQNEQIFAYHRETGDSVFLLDAGAVAYLQELEQKAQRLARLAIIVARDNHPQRDAAIDEEAGGDGPLRDPPDKKAA